MNKNPPISRSFFFLENETALPLGGEDVLSVEKGIIVHQVNCKKVMGAGLAKQLSEKFPQIRKKYLAKENWNLGDTQFVKIHNELFVCNLAGQFDYGRKRKLYTDYGALQIGFKKVNLFALKNNLDIFLPYFLGCGLARGHWDIVYSLIDYYLNSPSYDCFICKIKEKK
ncbi:hypothetical protein VKI22_03590 [Cyanobacterium aponinum UTEX 3221]|uniref:hypothetical protein n=1 Tax=Cyanobacterium aponinum TaxID=379064 RepID=UPI002B4C1AB2|nr:hypothetical protein [Cyanobacterium aponinum]WRL39194.1 hypothetical protein VKI22_03590 [Cyanobacterium aponinum UTEX 3221]